jgi:hypothetical protein
MPRLARPIERASRGASGEGLRESLKRLAGETANERQTLIKAGSAGTA